MDHLKLPQSRVEYVNALIDAAELGAKKALEGAGLLKPYLSVREAKRVYGPTVVDRWIKEDLLKVLKDGNASAKCRISRIQIEAVAKSANRATYLTIEERNPQKPWILY